METYLFFLILALIFSGSTVVLLLRGVMGSRIAWKIWSITITLCVIFLIFAVIFIR
ncbi:hypothetical protein ES702_01744 [subsurface metagenome]